MAPKGKKEHKKAKDTPKPVQTKNTPKKKVVEKKAPKIKEAATPAVTTPAVVAQQPKQQKTKGVAQDKKIDVSALRFRNKQKTLVFSSRGVTSQSRHLIQDLRTILPHSVKDAKLDTKDRLSIVNEVCEMKNASNAIFFEARKHRDFYMWLTNPSLGPSAKFLVQNIHTMDELRLVGNCLRGSRPIVSFSSEFDTQPHLSLLKEMLSQIFPTPSRHPKSKPFFDHVFTFSYLDNHIWFRNFQILWMDETTKATELVEIGPRFVLEPIRIFSGSMHGETIYQNSEYISPNVIRSNAKKNLAQNVLGRQIQKESSVRRQKAAIIPRDEVHDILRP